MAESWSRQHKPSFSWTKLSKRQGIIIELHCTLRFFQHFAGRLGLFMIQSPRLTCMKTANTCTYGLIFWSFELWLSRYFLTFVHVFVLEQFDAWKVQQAYSFTRIELTIHLHLGLPGYLMDSLYSFRRRAATRGAKIVNQMKMCHIFVNRSLSIFLWLLLCPAS